jgi:exosortase
MSEPPFDLPAGRVDMSVPPRPVSWVLPVCLAGVLAVILAGIYWGILRDLALQWWDDANYSHGFLVPVFTGYLIWRDRDRLRQIGPRSNPWGVVILILGIGALLIGDLGAENFLSRSSLILILAGLVLFILGKETLRVILFPLCFLFFMVPLPSIVFYAVTFPLQQLAAAQAAWALEALGVPVLLDGNIIHLSQISLGVTEACSGIRSLISLFAGAVAWAYLLLPGRLSMLLLVLATVPITIIANAGRVVATGLIGQWFGADYASGFFHELAGWVVYVFAFVCLIGLHAMIRWGERWSRRHTG